MRPLLASLALLLLALCRPASAGAATWDSAVSTADSALTLSAATRKAQGEKLVVGWTEAKQTALDGVMGNSLHALMLTALDKYKTLPEYYKKALDNGVLCELATTEIEKKIAKAQYGADALTPQHKIDEKALAKANHGIDCDGTTTDATKTCLCTAGKPLLYCLAEKLKSTATKVTCRDEAIAELKTKGKNELGKVMEEGGTGADMSQTADKTDALKPFSNVKLFCDGIDPAIPAAAEKVYAADALAWTLDSRTIADPEFGGDVDVAKACAGKLKDAPIVGKCLCQLKAGLAFCYAQTIGTTFKTAGYIDCGATPKFVEDKKNDAMKEFLKFMPEQPTTAAVPVVPAAGNDTVVTTAAPSDSAAASSLLVPLAAAAAMLLRH